MGDLHGLMVTICSLSKHGAPAAAQSTPIHNLINPRLNNLVLGMSAISFHHLSNNDAMTPTVKPILLYPDNSKAIKDDITWLLATSCHRSTCTTRLQTHLLLQSRDMGAYISYVPCFSDIRDHTPHPHSWLCLYEYEVLLLWCFCYFIAG